MLWFQYKPGVVGEIQRVTHGVKRYLDDGTIRSWCRREFDPEQIEKTAEPGAIPENGQARPGAPCVPCLLLVTASTNSPKEVPAPHTSALPAEPR